MLSSPPTSPSASSLSPTHAMTNHDVWIALVLEPNKFTAQSLLHYLKLLDFDPDLSFSFDTPSDLGKYLGDRSHANRHSRRRTTHGVRVRRIVVFANAQYKEQVRDRERDKERDRERDRER